MTPKQRIRRRSTTRARRLLRKQREMEKAIQSLRELQAAAEACSAAILKMRKKR